MKLSRIVVAALALTLMSGKAVAQSEEAEMAKMEAAVAAEAAQAEQAAAKEMARVRELEWHTEEEVRRVAAQEAEMHERLQAAELKMAEAARQIAEITSQKLPRDSRMAQRIEIIDDGKPRLGVTIGDANDSGPVEGVAILAVTPGTAASEAGLRTGDVLTAVNGESLSGDSAEAAMTKLMDFMAGVESGDTLDVEYLRDGKVGKVQVEPKPVTTNVFAFGGPNGVIRVPGIANAPTIVERFGDNFDFRWITDGWGDMELVELNEGLGRYFGTESGLLVVSAPAQSAFQLEDGDVIQKIDGREPTSVRHALRILGSYQAGEQLKLEIMRDKRSRTLDIEMPDDRSSFLFQGMPRVLPSKAPLLWRPAPGAPSERT